MFTFNQTNFSTLDYTNTNRSIKSWAEDDRPREKLILKGKAALSDAELIAILLGSGTKNETAVDVAKKILNSVDNNLNELGRLGVKGLSKFKGVGEAKAISIITAMELGKRRRQSEALDRKKIVSSAQAFEIMQPIIGDLPHEEFWVLYLSTSNKVLKSSCVSKGGLAGTLADVRMIFKEGITLNAVACVLAHNHPSGDPKPSPSDITLTKKMVEAGDIMDIKIMDHLIITEHEYYSFADDGRM